MASSNNATKDQVKDLQDSFEKLMMGQKNYFERILSEEDKSINIALQALKDAILASEAHAERWRVSADEWRAAMTDREKTFVMNVDFNAHKETIEITLTEIKTQLAGFIGKKQGLSDGWGYMVGAVGLVLAILGWWSN